MKARTGSKGRPSGSGETTGQHPQPCPICRAGVLADKYHIDRHAFDVVECNNCRCQFQDPFPQKTDKLYDAGYYTGESSFSYQDERQTEVADRIVHIARLKNLLRYLGSPGTKSREKFLDVGCAFGAFARSAEKYFIAGGLDVSRYAIESGNSISTAAGLSTKLYLGDLCHLPLQKGKIPEFFAEGTFAVISLVEVIEHLVEVRKSMEQAHRLLRPGGLLLVQTANFEGLQAVDAGSDYHYYLPGHLTYFTATGLKAMLSSIGFSAFYEFIPVDFPLHAKWRKSWKKLSFSGFIKSAWKMTFYHLISKFRKGSIPRTSSYVLYARK